MKRLQIAGLCVVAVFSLSAAIAATASAKVPTWYECGKTAKVGKYNNKACTEENTESKGKYELKEGLGKEKGLKGKGGLAVLHVKTWLGDNTIECAKSKSEGKLALPNLEKEVTVSFSKCIALKTATKPCQSGAKKGEIKISGLSGELGYTSESPTEVGLKLESEAHPGPKGELVKFGCGEPGYLEVTLTGGLILKQEQDVNAISKESTTVALAGEFIGNHEYEGKKYKPLVNILGWASEQSEIATEIEEDEKGEIAKIERPIIKALICGTFIRSLLGVECTPEAYAGLDQTTLSKGDSLMVKA
jgi:hypothetical protein